MGSADASGSSAPLSPAPLAAVLGVGRGALVGGLAEPQALQADAQARAVHHREHAAQPLVRLADEVALRLLEVHHAGGRAVDAHLLLDRAAGDAVGRPCRAVLLERPLRHQEEADAAQRPDGASGSFASTRWTMFSVRSCSPAEMKILVPESA